MKLKIKMSIDSIFWQNFQPKLQIYIKHQIKIVSLEILKYHYYLMYYLIVLWLWLDPQ